MDTEQMKPDRGIREWYRASRNGTKGEFLKDVQSLTCDSLIAMLRREISFGARSRLRTRSELEALPRAVCPAIETLQVAAPKEQTLQWMFMHRNYLCSTSESILCRELPTCCAGQRVYGRADLLAFDQALGQPVLVELKDGDAKDTLCGVVLELLYHWSFHMRHRDEFYAFLGEYGHETAAPFRLLLIAPQTFYENAKRRSKRWHGEFERAISWISALATSQVVSIDLYSLDADWQQQGIHFPIAKVPIS